MASVHRLAVVLLSLLVVPGVASAHEISGRFDAPLPLALLFVAAGATVGVTALVLAVTVQESADRDGLKTWYTLSQTVASGLRTVARGAFFVAFVLTLATGVLGRQVQAQNFATVFVWAVWLKGVAIGAALVGNPWRVLSPWRALYDVLCRVEGRPIAVLGEYPPWLGVLPALGWYLLVIGIVENLTVIPRSPVSTALLVVGYTLVMFLGALAFGPAWFRNADGLAVLYRLFGRVSPVVATRTDSGGYRIGFRAPWRGCTRSVFRLSMAAFVIGTVYTVSFDGFTSTPEYQDLRFGIQELPGIGPSGSVVLYVAGFFGFIVAFLVTLTVVQFLASDPDSDWQNVAVAFAPTILPIAVAYEVAHNYPFVLRSIGRLGAVLWPALGLSHGPTIDLLAWLSVRGFWWSQVLLIVLGHLVAVVAAHYVSIDRCEEMVQARRAHVPLVVLMVGYTVLSLWIISRPVVA